MRRIYVASSWRNAYQPSIVEVLRRAGHQVYDFRNPAPGNTGFRWSDIDPGWKGWDPKAYREALQHQIAADGYGLDFSAMQWADTCVLLLPAGRSASFELGWCMGAGKLGVVYIPEPVEPELMFRDARIVVNGRELLEALSGGTSPGADAQGSAEEQRRQAAQAPESQGTPSFCRFDGGEGTGRHPEGDGDLTLYPTVPL